MTLVLQKIMARMFSSHGKLRLMFCFLVLLCIILCLNISSQPDIRHCFMDPIPLPDSTDIEHRIEDVLLSDYKPPPGRSIFFHETSCHIHSWPGSIFKSSSNPVVLDKLKQVQLTARQACAIESAALHNPNFSVFVLFASPVYNRNATRNPLLNALQFYHNVYIRNLNLWTYAAGTPIYEWLKDGALFKSDYVLSHISDFLRYLTLWRFGGTYLDMDIVMLRTIEDLKPNYAGAESNTHLAAGVMNFAHQGFGHEIAEQCLRDFQRNFDGGDWGNNGPGVITRVMQTVCGTKNIAMMLNRKRCMGFQVFARDAFYAIPWKEWEHFFEAKYLEKTLERTRESYVVHVWNKHSVQRKIDVGSEVAYGKLAAKNCPRVYAASALPTTTDQFLVDTIDKSIYCVGPIPRIPDIHTLL